jgi:large subunit ribosomal protein L29
MKAALHIAELRTMDASDLNERLKEARTELFNLRFQAATGQLENHRQIRAVRHRIAQVLTVLQGRSMGFEELVVQSSGPATPTRERTGRGRQKEETPVETPAAAAESGEETE